MFCKNIFVVLVLFFLTINFTYAQKEPAKFGKVTDEELKMTVYDKDTSASAVILMHYGDIEMSYNTTQGFVTMINVLKRIKILTKEGLEYANQNVELYQSKSGEEEVLANFKAQTYNLVDGKPVISKITKKEVFTEQKSETRVSKNFALPNVQVGSVIEFEYTINSPFYWSIDPWYFQDEIPTVWSELRLKIPEYFSFNMLSGGYVYPKINEKIPSNGSIPSLNITYTAESRRLVYQDVPAFKVEEFITTPRDYLAKIEFELESTQFPGSMVKSYISTWKQIGIDLMADENFGQALDRHGMVKELTDQINPADSIESKILTAFGLIKKTMKWDESNGIFISGSLRSVSNKKQGNMAEINLLLVNLLRSVNIEAYPVLISTRDHGTINQFYPRLSAFNTVLAMAKVKGKNVLMDATIAYLRPGQLTFNTINGQGLVVSKEGVDWINLLSAEEYNTVGFATIEIKDGEISAKLSRGSKSLEALRKRHNIASAGKEKYIEDYKKNNSNWEISDYTIENDDNAGEILTEKISIKNFNNLDASGDIIYLPSVLIDEMKENPFSSESREYPIDFGVPRMQKFTLNISVPEGYSVDELPKNTSVSLPENAGLFKYMIQQNGNTVQVVTQFKITRTLFLPSEYLLLKELYQKIISKYGEQIVLKKKI